MKKYILGLTTVALLCSPLAYADDTMGQDQQMTAPTTTDSVPSTPSTTTTPSTTSTPDTATTDVQFKTLDGKIIHAQMDPQDLQGMNVGDKLEVTDLGNSATTSSGASTSGTSNITPDTTNNTGTTTNGSTNDNNNGAISQ
jgi:hypothetical protein